MTDRSESCCDTDLLRADMGDEALALAVTGFAALWHGQPVAPDQLGLGDSAVAAEIMRIQAANGRLEQDDRGQLVGVHGITLSRTRHRFEHADLAHHTWCAFDSIGIPAALGLDATAHTDCPTCRRQLAVAITGGDPDNVEAVLWLPTSQCDNLMNDFCARADLYCSLEHLHERIDAAATPGSVVSLSEAAALGRDVWADVVDLDLH